MRVKLTSSAHLDIQDGWCFYNSQQEGLGDYFSDTIYSEIGSLSIYGGIHKRVYGFHQLLTRRFPYAVYYDVLEGDVVVFAVVDCRRNPTWIADHLASV